MSIVPVMAANPTATLLKKHYIIVCKYGLTEQILERLKLLTTTANNAQAIQSTFNNIGHDQININYDNFNDSGIDTLACVNAFRLTHVGDMQSVVKSATGSLLLTSRRFRVKFSKVGKKGLASGCSNLRSLKTGAKENRKHCGVLEFVR